MQIMSNAMRAHRRLLGADAARQAGTQNAPRGLTVQRQLTGPLRPLGCGAADQIVVGRIQVDNFTQSAGVADTQVSQHPCVQQPSIKNVLRAGLAGGYAGLISSHVAAIWAGTTFGVVHALNAGAMSGLGYGLVMGLTFAATTAAVLSGTALACAAGIVVARAHQKTDVSRLFEELSGHIALAPRQLLSNDQVPFVTGGDGFYRLGTKACDTTIAACAGVRDAMVAAYRGVSGTARAA